MTSSSAPENNRPYGPPSNLIDILGRLRRRNLPEIVDAEYLKDANISKGTISRTLFGLNFLGLTNEAHEPTEALKSIALSDDDRYQEILAQLVRTAYKEVFETIDPSQDDQSQIVNFFRRYTPGSQRERMVVFFLGMCREAGIPTLDVPRKRPTQASRPRNAARPTATPRSSTSNSVRAPATAPVQAAVRYEPTLEALIQSLPQIGDAFPEDRREQWINMARAILDFLYPETGSAESGISEDDDMERVDALDAA